MVSKHRDNDPAVLVHTDAGWVAQNSHTKAAEIAPVLIEHLDSVVAVVADEDPVVIVDAEVPGLLHLPDANQSDAVSQAVEDLHPTAAILCHNKVSTRQNGHANGPLELAISGAVCCGPELAEKDALTVKNLDSVIVKVCHSEISNLVHRHAPWSVELTLLGALRADGRNRRALAVEDLDAVIPCVRNKDAPSRPVDSQATWSVELASTWAFGAELEEETATAVEHLNAMVSRVRDQKITSVVGADGERAGELPVSAALRAKGEDGLVHRLVAQLLQHGDLKRTPLDVLPF